MGAAIGLMARERRSRGWWADTVARWKSSGLTAEQFATGENLQVRTLRWWSSELQRGTVHTHGSSGAEPIEIAVEAAAVAGAIEIAVGDVIVRYRSGADVAYVASLVRALRD